MVSIWWLGTETTRFWFYLEHFYWEVLEVAEISPLMRQILQVTAIIYTRPTYATCLVDYYSITVHFNMIFFPQKNATVFSVVWHSNRLLVYRLVFMKYSLIEMP